MKTLLVLLLFCAPVFAKDAPTGNYQEGMLVKFEIVSTGQQCRGGGHGQVDESGNVNMRQNSQCHDTYAKFYIVKVGENTLVLQPKVKTFQFRVPDVLGGKLPGTKFQLANDSKDVVVRVGQKESKYVVTQMAGKEAR